MLIKNIYFKILSKGLDLNILDIDSKILVVACGPNDSETLNNFGFSDLLITNLAPHGNHLDYTPYQWEKADLNQLKFKNDSFDFVIVSEALHHMYSPHRGLGEMQRVARKGIVVMESSNSLISKIARKLGFVPDYEIDAILRTGTGGVENSHIPNFIYRWTESEVKKTINSFLPHVSNKIYFIYNYRFPLERFKRSKKRFIRLLFPLLSLALKLYKIIFPKQANEFGFIVSKGKNLKPWLDGGLEDPKLNLEYIREKYVTQL